MFLSEDRTEIHGVLGRVATSLFRVNPTTSKGVRFCSESPGTETDDEVELREVLGPTGLSTGEQLGSGKVFQVLVVGDNVNRSLR